jgi:uncharacterized surface protein with fasciclin (FAS1) repeats
MSARKIRISMIGLLASVSLVAAACGDDEEPTAASGSPATTEAAEPTESEMDTEMESEMGTEMEEDAEMTASAPVGPACASVPTDGEGSLEGMADDPAATAASNNPELSTLVTAVTEAGLVDTLNGEGPFTIFAPVNSAFAALPEADLNAVLADQELLTSILTLHVVAGEQLDAAALMAMDTVDTVNGASLTLATEGDSLMVNGQASVVCANIETANATVHLIDAVLMP